MEIMKLFKKAEEANEKIEAFDSESIKKIIREFILSKKPDTELLDKTDLFENGYVNSLFALEIVTFIEKNFKIKLSRRDISKENFQTVEKITELVERLLNK